MHKNLAYSLIAVLAFFIILTIDVPISNTAIAGLYINNNFEEGPFYAEIPYIKDTLILNENGTYNSIFFSDGTYKIKSGFFGNQLILSYEIEQEDFKSIPEISKSETGTKKITGIATHTFRVNNRLFQPIRIYILRDLNYFYSKSLN